MKQPHRSTWKPRMPGKSIATTLNENMSRSTLVLTQIYPLEMEGADRAVRHDVYCNCPTVAWNSWPKKMAAWLERGLRTEELKRKTEDGHSVHLSVMACKLAVERGGMGASPGAQQPRGLQASSSQSHLYLSILYTCKSPLNAPSCLQSEPQSLANAE